MNDFILTLGVSTGEIYNLIGRTFMCLVHMWAKEGELDVRGGFTCPSDSRKALSSPHKKCDIMPIMYLWLSW